MNARRAIKQAIIDSLSRISVMNGYHNDIALITKRLKTHEELGGQYPALCVLTGLVNKTPEDSGIRLWRCEAVYMVVGYVKVDTDIGDEGLLSDAADDLLEDIEKALLTDTTLTHASSSVISLLLLQAEQPYLDWVNNRGEVAVTLGVQYTHEQQP